MRFKNLTLRMKFMIGSTFGIVFLMGLVILAIENRQSQTLLNQTEKRAVAISKNIAAVITNLLLSYNYITLQQHADKVVREEDIRYVIIFDKEYNMAAFSGHPQFNVENRMDILSQWAKEVNTISVQTIDFREPGGKRGDVMDIVVPVYLEDQSVKWGTVRVGLSLESMERELLQTRIILLIIGIVAVCLALGGTTFLSRRITEPIESLVRATMLTAQGELNHTIHIEGRDEIGILGESFNRMVESLGKRTRELVETKNYLDRVIESSPDAITVVNAKGDVITFNEAAEKLTNYKAKEVVGRPISALYSDPHEFEKIQNLLMQRGKLRNYETTILNKEEKLIPIGISLSIIRGENDQPVGSVGISKDLREIKQLQQRLFQSERLAATAKLAASIAHEVSNPIYGIQNCIDLVSDEIRSDNPKRQYLDLAKKEIERVAALVRQMVDFHRPTDEPLRTIHLNTLLSEILVLEEKSLKRAAIQIIQDFDLNLPTIVGAENQLKQVFYNIIINAREAMPEGGQLSLSTRHENQHVRINISDTGKGIFPDDLDRIFEPFFTTKPEVKGVGLGLSVSYGIIQKHEGNIDVKTEIHKGTTFTITLPIKLNTNEADEKRE